MPLQIPGAGRECSDERPVGTRITHHVMYYLGSSLIIGAIVSALLSAGAFVAVVRGRSGLLKWGRRGVFVTMALTFGSAALILALFVLQRYDVRYVYDYTSKDLELRYRIAAVLAGQSGSLVVWGVGGLGRAPFLMGRNRHFED